jgi:hypothetical protein
MTPILAAFLGLLATPGGALAQPGDAALHQALLGVWCNSNDGGRTCWAYDEFFDDGRFEACGRTDDDPRPFRGQGRVTVIGQRMCYQVTLASANFWIQPGGRFCTDIVAIEGAAHRYRDIDTGAEFVLHRIPKSEKRCPD